MQKTLKILAVDDTPENLSLLEHFVRRQKHVIIKAECGEQAIERFKTERPDLILMDVMMPEMDGYEVTRRIREIAGDHWIPIIFMSAMTSTEDQIEGLDAGGDDYLTKPVTLKILAAKIMAMQRIADMREDLARQATELALYRKAAEEEKVFANRLMEHMTQVDSFRETSMDTWSLPTEQLNGDLVAACRTADNKLFCMVSDATGHGLLAAIMQLPVSQTFYEMAAEGCSLESIVTTMNRRLRKVLPRDRFVAATLVMVDYPGRHIEVWNGGSPDALLLNQTKNIIHRFVSTGMPLGVMPEAGFAPQTEHYVWDENVDLVLYSDGVIDAVNEEGVAYGESRLERELQVSYSLSACRHIAESLNAYLKGKAGQDDISVVSIHCGMTTN